MPEKLQSPKIPRALVLGLTSVAIVVGLILVISAVALSTARTGFVNPWVSDQLIAGVFATIVAAYLGFMDKPDRADLLTYIGAMALLIVVGVIGAILHVQADLTADSKFVLERFLRGAPFMAPMQFSNQGLLGLIVLLDPNEI